MTKPGAFTSGEMLRTKVKGIVSLLSYMYGAVVLTLFYRNSSPDDFMPMENLSAGSHALQMSIAGTLFALIPVICLNIECGKKAKRMWGQFFRRNGFSMLFSMLMVFFIFSQKPFSPDYELKTMILYLFLWCFLLLRCLERSRG